MTARSLRISSRLVLLAAAVLLAVAPSLFAAEGDAAAEAPAGFGWWSLAPAAVAIVLAVALRRVLVALLAGVFVGALVIAGGNPLRGAYESVETHLWGAVVDGDHLRVVAFTLMMGAMVGVITRGGGMHGVVKLLLPLARGRRGGQLTTWALGLAIFFDDYANTVVLGTTMRAVADRLRISRAKLAYVVDSTAAPIAGLALVSTWVTVEVDYIANGLEAVGLSRDGAYGLFIASIPARFYVLWALVLVVLIALLGRDFGPMHRAERDAVNRPAGHGTLHAWAGESELMPAPDAPSPWWLAAAPVGVVVAVFAVQLGVVGLSEFDSFHGLFYAALSGLVTAVLLARVCGLLDGKTTGEAAFAGAKTMLPGVYVLVFAWALAGVMSGDHLDAGGFLADLLSTAPAGGPVPEPVFVGVQAVLPAGVFVLAAVMSFATGTSWGTMAILTPLSIQVAFAAANTGGTEVTIAEPLLVHTVAAVLAGAIFGDHCSPISDTTVLSSQASGCDHLEHVWTQMPYALTVGGLAAAGLLLSGVGVPVWIVLIAGVGVLAVVVRFVGRRVEDG